MKLVTFVVPTPVGQIQRIGAIYKNKIIDLNMGYARYLSDKHGSNEAYELAEAMLPPDMITFFRRGQERKDRAELTIDFVARHRVKGGLVGPREEKIVYEMNEVKLKAPVPRPNSLRDYCMMSASVHASPATGSAMYPG